MDRRLTRVLVLSLGGLGLVSLGFPREVRAETYFVTTNVDLLAPSDGDGNPGDGVCDNDLGPGPHDGTPCTLRAAIEEANADPGVHTIDFSALAPLAPTPEFVWEFAVHSALPTITTSVTIDGTTYPGTSCGTLVPDLPSATNTPHDLQILLRHDELLPPFDGGLSFGPGAAGSTVRGLVIQDSRSDPNIEINGNLVDGATSGVTIECNYLGTDVTGMTRDNPASTSLAIQGVVGPSETLVRNNLIAVELQIFDSSAITRVEGNLIGLRSDGFGIPGGFFQSSGHVNCVTSAVRIGGSERTLGNAIIGGSMVPGVSLQECTGDIQNNFFGMDLGGAPQGQPYSGVALMQQIARADAQINIADNVIGNQQLAGLTFGVLSIGNAPLVVGNLIGVLSDGITPAPNGIGIALPVGMPYPFSVQIGDGTPDGANTIAHNAQVGIAATGGRFALRHNHFFANGDAMTGDGLAIKLLPTTFPGPPFPGPLLNDDGDADNGVNDFLNFPVIESAAQDGPDWVVTGFAPAGAEVEFYFADDDPSGFGEGEIPIVVRTEGDPGQDTDMTTGAYNNDSGVEANANRFSFRFPRPVAAGDTITALATLNGATSEFSRNFTVTLSTVPDLRVREFLTDNLECEELILGGSVDVRVAEEEFVDVSSDFDVTLFVDRDGDGLLTGADSVVATQTIAGGLAAGDESTVTLNVPSGVSLDASGQDVRVLVDRGDAVNEVDEDNNGASFTVLMCDSAPADVDLVATGVDVTTSGHPDEIVFDVTFDNGGTDKVELGVFIAFYDDDPNAGGMLLGTTTTQSAIAPDGSGSATFVWESPPAMIAALSRTIWVVVDDDGSAAPAIAGSVAESDETNNTVSAAWPQQTLSVPADEVGLAGGALGCGLQAGPGRMRAATAFGLLWAMALTIRRVRAATRVA